MDKKEANRILTKLEEDLSQFMIGEVTRGNPQKRNSPEAFVYRGLTISADPKKDKNSPEIISVRIGSMEADFKLNGEKASGGLTPDEEFMIRLWMKQSDTSRKLMDIFALDRKRRVQVKIVPFDLENMY